MAPSDSGSMNRYGHGPSVCFSGCPVANARFCGYLGKAGRGGGKISVHDAEIFVGVLGASSYTYAEASFTQTLPDWIGAHVRMFRCWVATAAAGTGMDAAAARSIEVLKRALWTAACAKPTAEPHSVARISLL
jgi:hypothetical protein